MGMELLENVRVCGMKSCTYFSKEHAHFLTKIEGSLNC